MPIDAYSHILPPRYFTRMRELATDADTLKRWLELPALHDVEARLAMMEEFGRDFSQILTLSSPPPELLAGPADSPALARLANETMAELVEEHPARFPSFVASLPMNNPTASLAEIGHALDRLGACGVQVFTNVNGIPLDDPRFRPILEEMARRRLPVWMHPTRSARTADYATEDASRYEIWWALGWPYETSAAMARLVFSGILEDLPDLVVITHHMGAMIPFLEARIRLGWDDQLGSRTTGAGSLRRLNRPAVEYFRRFVGDTAVNGSTSAMRCGLDFFGAENVVFASDCPFDPEGGPLYIREILRALHRMNLPDRILEGILDSNVHRLTRGIASRRRR